MNDPLGLIAILGISYLLLNQNKENEFRIDKEGYKNFKSNIYPITFKYPGNWVKNPNYEERYDGPDGFFEVVELEGFGRPIDKVTQQEISIPIKPYGANPAVESLEVDGEPARVIVPSEDQNKVFDREVAMIVKNKRPVIEGSENYDYTVIFTTKNFLPTIISSYRFL